MNYSKQQQQTTRTITTQRVAFDQFSTFPLNSYVPREKSIPSLLNILIWQRNSIYLFHSMNKKWVWACVHVLFARTTLLSVHFIFLLPLVTSRFNPPFLFNDYRLFSSRTHCIKAIYNSNNSSSSSKLTHFMRFPAPYVCNMCDTSTSYWNDWLCSYTTFYIYIQFTSYGTQHTAHAQSGLYFLLCFLRFCLCRYVCVLSFAHTHIMLRMKWMRRISFERQ